MSSLKQYIGDSVYADYNDFGELVLTTENGYHDDPRNPGVLQSLLTYITWAQKERVQHAD